MAIGTIIALWAGLVYKLTSDWSTNAQYQFGWFVPIFIGYLLLLRWQDRPVPKDFPPKALIVIAGIIGLLFLLPIRVVEEANADWRPLNWVWAGDIVFLTLLYAAFVGGWAWMRHFAIPLFLIFFALSWPLVVEQSVIQSLARFVAKATVELLSWMDIPALDHGNVIELAGGQQVGIADACTGVRSIAGTLMASFFLGEIYRLKWFRRVILMGGGVCLALLLNLCRTTFLSYETATAGAKGFSQWHDPAGNLIFGIVFLGLWRFSVVLKTRSDARPRQITQQTFLEIPRGVAAAVLVWLVFIEVANASWYYFHEPAHPSTASWAPNWPAPSENFQFQEVSDEARAILRYNEGSSGQIFWPDGTSWYMSYFLWRPGRTSSQLALMHRPEICLPAAGLIFAGEGPGVSVAAAGLILPFNTTLFDENGNRIYVFRCVWENGLALSVGNVLDLSIAGRLKAVWYGRRNLGQSLLQVSISGVNDEQEAERQLKERLPGIVMAVKNDGRTL